MKTNSFKTRSILFLSASLLIIFSLSSCGEDETPTLTSKSAVWSSSVDGNFLAGDEIEILKMNETDYSVKALQKTEDYFIIFYLSSSPQVKAYDLSNSECEIYYTSGNESTDAGELVISKYDADSLVATFSFTAGVYEVTNGIIKARLR